MTETEQRAAGAMIEAQRMQRALRQSTIGGWGISIHVGRQFCEDLRRDLTRWRNQDHWGDQTLAGFPVVIDDNLDDTAVVVRAERRIP